MNGSSNHPFRCYVRYTDSQSCDRRPVQALGPQPVVIQGVPMRSSTASRAAAVVVAGLTLAACGSSPTAGPATDTTSPESAENSASVETYERFNAMSGQQRTDDLKKCAEEEVPSPSTPRHRDCRPGRRFR